MATGKFISTKAHPLERPSSGTYRVAVRNVLTRPDVRLSLPGADVDPCHPHAVALADALVATMRAARACIGLAATQVGAPARLFCMDVTGHRRARSCAGLVVLCNPRILWWSHQVILREGCLSVPHLTGNVARAEAVTVEGFEPATGHVVRLNADGIEARCVQHEIDHLDGFVFVDRVINPVTDLFARRSYA